MWLKADQQWIDGKLPPEGNHLDPTVWFHIAQAPHVGKLASKAEADKRATQSTVDVFYVCVKYRLLNAF